VVGAGPKGIAIAAKARALAAAGLQAPRVVLVDRGEVAGNWSGRQGYTSGLLPLGTPPEKDVGYPYAASWGHASADVVVAMAEYSWQRHLIRHGVYSDWVDRGRMRPTHRQWSVYLREVAEAAEAEIVRGVVTGLEVAGDGRWEVTLEAGDAIAADGVVMTGAGPAITVPGQPRDHSRVLDGRTYWLAADKLDRGRALNVCVIGSGETAASVVIDLVKRCHKRSMIDVLAARGVLYSRGESYDENRLYSDPGEWPLLAETHRREFLQRTDRGVFSLAAEAVLNQARGFRALAGRAAAVEAREHDVIVTIAYGDERERVAYDVVVAALGAHSPIVPSGDTADLAAGVDAPSRRGHRRFGYHGRADVCVLGRSRAWCAVTVPEERGRRGRRARYGSGSWRVRCRWARRRRSGRRSACRVSGRG